jgi:tetratricopeptide (TPR) repeat protein
MLRPRSIGLLLALATLLVYLPATSYQFINYDDPDYVADNPVVKNGLTWAGVKWAFMGAHAANWHPLTWLSHMADCDLFRLNPGGPHLVNSLFHAANTALLFLLLLRLTNLLWPSAFIAALFAWHPLHVESVAWIAERKDVLSTFFALLTLLSYTRYVQENRRRSYWFALFFFVLALLSKPMPVTLPVVMLLLDYWPLNRVAGCRLQPAGSAAQTLQPSTFNLQLSIIWEKWPFFLLAAASCVGTVLAQHHAVSSLANVPLGLRLENALTAYAGYLWKMVWPVNLAIFYPLRAPIAWQLITESAIVLTGISVIVWRERKGSPWLVVGWLWFLVTLVPVIGLVQVGSQAMADRYSYFPLIGIFLAIAFSAQSLAGRFSFLKKGLSAAAILILGACVLLTEKQLTYWHDSELLFTHAFAVEQSDIAHINLGSALQDQNRMSEAMAEYIMAWRLNPESYLAYGNIARILDGEGKTEQAAIFYQKSVQRKPMVPSVYENLGLVLQKLGRYDEAMKEFSEAAKIDPSDARPHYLMGRLLLLQGIASVKQGNLGEAQKKFSAAAQIDPKSSQPRFFMGRILLQQGNDVEGLKELRAALQLERDNLEILVFTASVLAADENPGVRDGAEARMLADRVVKLTDHRQPAALDTLAMACAETGQFDQAIQIQQQAIKLAEAGSQKDDLAVMQQRLQLYLKHQPWRTSFKKN